MIPRAAASKSGIEEETSMTHRVSFGKSYGSEALMDKSVSWKTHVDNRQCHTALQEL